MKKIILLILPLITLFANVSNAIIDALPLKEKALVKQLYALNNHQYLWLNHPLKLSKAVHALSNGYFNYKNKNYHQVQITQLLYLLDAGGLSEYQKAKLDVLISDGYIALLRFIRQGDVDWNLVKQKLNNLKTTYDINAVWEIHPKAMVSASTILRFIQSGRVNALLQQSVGLHDRYKSYIDILQYYRKIPEFKKVPYGPLIQYGHRDKRIYEIKRRLLVLGYFPRHGSINRKYDKDLYIAIRKFEKSFNLPLKTTIDNKLIAYINLPKSYYIKKIIINLDKTKLYPYSFEPTYVEVNVPEFMMRFYQNGQEVFSSPVVVGKLDSPTPIFSDYIEYIVINPTWTVPENLIKKELIPTLKQYPNLFEMAHLRVYQRGREVKPNIQKLLALEGTNKPSPYRIVQDPGPDNALGRVKFMFPNKYSVYLHDTPEKGLFNHRYRYNSSGCMRMENPLGFLEYLRPYLTRDYENALNSGKTLRINLKRKIPIHIVYFTLDFTYDGSPKFMYDAYMYDKIIEESTKGNIKYTFEMPKVRLKEVGK